MSVFGRVIGVALVLSGVAAAAAIFAGSFRARFVAGLPVLWLLFGVLVLVGATMYSVSSRRLAAEHTVRGTGLVLLALGAAAGAALWARARGGLRVDAPVQLWLLLAVCLISGGVAVYSSRL
jgi:ABC-type uncharacterized transport system permease subunit